MCADNVLWLYKGDPKNLGAAISPPTRHLTEGDTYTVRWEQLL